MKEMTTVRGARIDWPQLTRCKDVGEVEETNKVSKTETKMGPGEVTRSMTESARYTRRKSRGNGM